MKAVILSAVGFVCAMTVFAGGGEMAATSGPSTRPRGLIGTVVKVDGDNVIVDALQGRGTTQATVATDANTDFTVNFEPGSKLTDLKPGMLITVTPLPNGKVIISAHANGLTGTVVSQDGRNIVVRHASRGGASEEVTVTTTPLRETPRHPALLTVEASSKGRSGRLVRIDGKNVVLKTASAQAGGEAIVATDENTRCILLAHSEESGLYEPCPCRLSELTAGMPVKALPETGTASKIIAHQVSRWAARPASKPAATAPAESQPSASGAEKIKQLRLERLEILRTLERSAQVQFEKGLTSGQEVMEAGLAVLEAQLELCETPAARIAVCEQRVKVAKMAEEREEGLWKEGRTQRAESHKAKAIRLKAEVDLEKARLEKN